MGYSYINGQYILTQDVALPYSSDQLGSLRGYRFFTSLKCVGFTPICVTDHVNRLFLNANQLSMAMPSTKEELASRIVQVLEYNRNQGVIGDLVMQIIVSAGSAQSGSLRLKGNTAVYIIVTPVDESMMQRFKQGVRLGVIEYQRAYPTIKFTNYVGAVMAAQSDSLKDVDDVLYTCPKHQGRVLEGSTFSVFGVQNNQLYTPALDDQILAGITRQYVLDLCQNNGIQTNQTHIQVADLVQMDEVFLTSSIKGVMPICSIDQTHIGAKTPGKLTAQIQRYWDHFIQSQIA